MTKYFNFATPDPTPNSLYPSAVNVFPYVKMKDINPIPLSVGDVSRVSANEWETEATILLQDQERALGKVLPMGSLHIRPMYSQTDGIAMLLPLDNRVNRSYLTYQDPLWGLFLKKLYKAFKQADCGEGLDACRTLVVAYNRFAPYCVEIRHDGTSAVSSDSWKPDDMKCFSIQMDRLFRKNLDEAIDSLSNKESGFESYIPNMNVTHSTGFNQRSADGTLITKREFEIVPRDLVEPKYNLWAKYDMGPFKEEMVHSGRVDENLDMVLSEMRQAIRSPSKYLDFLWSENCSVHKVAYRDNNADPALNDQGDFDDWANGKCDIHFFHKNRAWCRPILEEGRIIYESGTYDCKKLNSNLSSNFSTNKELDSNKKRKVYPAPTVTFSPPYIAFFRALLLSVEESKNGFPANRPGVLANYAEYFEYIQNAPRTWIAFDRKNSEQFITDNYDKLSSLLAGSELSTLIQFLGISIFPSEFGGRVVKGGLPSGSAATTFLNVVFGMFENINVVKHIVGDAFTFDEVCKLWFQAMVEEKPALVIGNWVFKINLGTDDQIIGVSCKSFRNSETLNSFLKQACDSLPPRSLGFDVGPNQTVFGMDFHETEVVVSKTLGLNKVFLSEHARLGDAIALKMFARLQLLQDYVPIIQDVFDDLGLGTLSSYTLGADNYFAQISKFTPRNVLLSPTGNYFKNSKVFDPAEVVSEELTHLFNEFSPKDKLIVGKAFEKYDVDIMQRRKKYEREDVLRWLLKMRKGIFNK